MNPKKILKWVALSLVFIFLTPLIVSFFDQNDAQTVVPKNMVIATSAYAYSTSPTQKNGAAFLKIDNVGTLDDRLIGVQTESADHAELHTMSMDEQGMMEMRQVKGFDIPSGGTVYLRPAGNHIMLMGLKNPLEIRQSFALSLEFEKSGVQTVEVTIFKAGTAPFEP